MYSSVFCRLLFSHKHQKRYSASALHLRKCNFSALAVGVVLRILGNLGHDVGITGQRVHDILDRGDAPKSFTVWRNI